MPKINIVRKRPAFEYIIKCRQCVRTSRVIPEKIEQIHFEQSLSP